ncbi:hypothetical protein ACLMJK_006794 [Lecanora helva]
MPITALSANTVNALGSTQVLTDPVSLVKELIENSIDSQASAISVEISADTLGDVRVRDNGHGINPDDRPLICQRYATSKIRDLNELEAIGGRSLGFRGVALASVAEICGRLMISTRVEGEETASEIQFNHQGHPTEYIDLQGRLRSASKTSKSLPIGTTVRVERFLEAFPVRKRTAEKTSTKTLAKIKRTLQAYALAKPHLRLTLKVLRAKDEKANWKYPLSARVYRSGLGPCSFDAAVDVLGKRVLDQCQWTQSAWSITGTPVEETSKDSEANSDQGSGYVFQAVLAKRGCVSSTVSNIGQYLSVDSRPVSCSRVIFKKIVSLYKSHLRSATDSKEATDIVDPVLRLNIVCPPRSYDINVEPAKDDVLFTDSELIIDLAKKFFARLYGEMASGRSTTASAENFPKPRGLELMLARKETSRKPGSSLPCLSQGTSFPSGLLSSRENFVSPKASPEKEAETLRDYPLASSLPPANPIRVPENEINTVVCAQSDPSTSDEILATTLAQPPAHLQNESPGRATLPEIQPAWQNSMYVVEDENDEGLLDSKPSNVDNDAMDEGDDPNNIQLSNPWAFAKLNAASRARCDKHREAISDDDDDDGNYHLPTPHRQIGDVGYAIRSSADSVDHASPAISESPPYKESQHRGLNQYSPSFTAAFPFPLRARTKRKPVEHSEDASHEAQKINERGLLDTWVQKSYNVHPTDSDLFVDSELDGGAAGPADVLTPKSFVSARTLPRDVPSNQGPSGSTKRRSIAAAQKHQNSLREKQQIAPVHDLEKVWFDMGSKVKRKQSQPTNAKHQQRVPESLLLRDDEAGESIASSLPASQGRSIHPDLAATLDYEARKQLATQQHREKLRQQAVANRHLKTSAEENTAPASSPHSNRQRAAIAALHREGDDSAPFTRPQIYTPGDPRAYLIRTHCLVEAENQKDPTQRKTIRKKTHLLPFETLHPNDYIGDLIHVLDAAKCVNFKDLVAQGSKHDDYIRDGVMAHAFKTQTPARVQAWEKTLKELVKRQYRIEGMAPEEEMDGELDCDLSSILQDYAMTTSG